MTNHLEGFKFENFRIFPPKRWWTEGHWSRNHPISHFVGGALAYASLALIFPETDWWALAKIVGVLGAFREELQTEFQPSTSNHLWDAIFVFLGALAAGGLRLLLPT